MQNYSFSSQSGKSYYYNSISSFIRDNPYNVIGQLVNNAFEIGIEQRDAWECQIDELQKRLSKYGMVGDIIFEYDIVRLGKRIDVILLIRHVVFSLEFKNGKDVFTAKDAQQAEDYAIDIKNFHKESEDLYVCPILIATNAKEIENQSIACFPDKQVFLQKENIESFIPKVSTIIDLYGSEDAIDFDKWYNSPYFPTPTIVDAAIETYSYKGSSQIARSEAGQADIDICENKIKKIIEYARTNNRKCVCFVTGVPGAGKTLVGLNIVSKTMDSASDDRSIYISGNGPLVDVLKEALIRSSKEKKQYKNGAVEALIQGSYAFKKDNSVNHGPTAEHILVFDEAQRVWNMEKMVRKHNNDPSMQMSEPHLLYSIMDRHKDWAVMICLVGLGQDIYDGEVGINEWFRCGIKEFDEWELFYSSKIFSQIEDRNIDKEMIEGCNRCHVIDELHLKTSIRSFRAENQCHFVDSLLDNNPEEAKKYYDILKEKYPIFITRDYQKAKQWVRSQVRGSQRCGVLACSSAQRLKPEGIYVNTDIDVKNWFLAPSDDLRSSNMLEIVASEFKVQGLEIDWSVVCWDADLRRDYHNENWDYYNFRGTAWNKRNKAEQKRYLINAYRVLLTRARQGFVIFVPYGVSEETDRTRNSKFYDGIYNYLISCGIQTL